MRKNSPSSGHDGHSSSSSMAARVSCLLMLISQLLMSGLPSIKCSDIHTSPISSSSSSSSQMIANQNQQLPTVIVRGFLNYRTTVDGTVLLFTPEAASGHQQQQQQVQISATPTALLPSSSISSSVSISSPQQADVILPSLAPSPSQIEPTKVFAADSSSYATQLVTQKLESRSGAESTSEEPISGPRQSTPSVQSDEIQPPSHESRQAARFEEPPRSAEQLGSTGEPLATAKPWQPKRPSRGSAVSGLTARPPSSSLSSLRRPSLLGLSHFSPSSSSTTTSTTQSPDLVVAGASGSSNFQSRLANASQKLKNKLKHKHPIVGVPSGSSSSRPPKLLGGSTSSTTSTSTTETPPAGGRLQPVELQQGQLGLGDSPPSLESFFGQPEVGGLEPSEAAGASAASLSAAFIGSGSGNSNANSKASPSANATLASSQPLQPSFGVSPLDGQLSSAATPTPVLVNASAISAASEQFKSAVNSTMTISNTTTPITVTRTYSTVSTSSKTRIVPNGDTLKANMQTITEIYVITKLVTSYQTLAPGEMPSASDADSMAALNASLAGHEHPEAGANSPDEQPISLGSGGQSSGGSSLGDSASSLGAAEQPIARPESWAPSEEAQNQQTLAQLNFGNLASLGTLGNLNGLDGSTDILEQLASGAIPSSQLADLAGQLNSIPDLNNPIVLAAAIQNPQLAAVILAAQQLRLKQQLGAARQPGQAAQPPGQLPSMASPNAFGAQNAPVLAAVAPQTSLSVSYSTIIKPSVQTVRDTLYTTRLVSFKDGRTMRTRTVSEPGSVIEQLVTTLATEITPITITMTLRPSVVLPTAAPASQLQAMQMQLAAPNGAPMGAQSQSTIQNAIVASQLASMLAKRQQQMMQQQQANNMMQQQQQQQLQQLQQFQQQQQQQQQQQHQAQPFQLQPQQQQQQPQSQFQKQQNQNLQNQQQQQSQNQPQVGVATPPLPSVPVVSGPITTTLTSLHVRTYTVHNAFKTIFRTITSTQLITSTIKPPTQTQAAG